MIIYYKNYDNGTEETIYTILINTWFIENRFWS